LGFTTDRPLQFQFGSSHLLNECFTFAHSIPLFHLVPPPQKQPVALKPHLLSKPAFNLSSLPSPLLLPSSIRDIPSIHPSIIFPCRAIREHLDIFVHLRLFFCLVRHWHLGPLRCGIYWLAVKFVFVLDQGCVE